MEPETFCVVETNVQKNIIGEGEQGERRRLFLKQNGFETIKVFIV